MSYYRGIKTSAKLSKDREPEQATVYSTKKRSRDKKEDGPDSRMPITSNAARLSIRGLARSPI
jgi:hypothetical protein